MVQFEPASSNCVRSSHGTDQIRGCDGCVVHLLKWERSALAHVIRVDFGSFTIDAEL
jgi:hypothetical protein